MSPFAFLLLIPLLISCGESSRLVFHDLKQEALDRIKQSEEQAERIQAQRIAKAIEQKRIMAEIVFEAQESFQTIRPLLKNKCFACHDSNTKLPIYGRILRNRNPVNKHREDGIKALDFVLDYPLSAQGNPPQLSLLRTLRNSITDRSMPLKIYTAVYPRKKISDQDEKDLLAWIDPLIQKLVDYDERYSVPAGTVEAQTAHIFEQKCYRCHANGNNRGSFGGMEDLARLSLSKYVDAQNPEASGLYTIMQDGEMPPNPKEAMTQDELVIIRDWIESIKPRQ
jgi:mono/diheme cytochrome c family protein